MKIGSNDSVNRKRIEQEAKSNAQKLLEKQPNTQGAIDKVSLGAGSVIAEEVSVEKILSERDEKVKRIKEMYQAGTYQIPSSEVLADKLLKGIQDELEFFKGIN